MWAGVQNVSRPIVMCQAMSQMSPTTMLVAANTVAARGHDAGSARARAGSSAGRATGGPAGGA
jgi:hypothetical protein